MQSFSAKNRTPGLSERHLFRKRIHLYCSALLLLYIYNVSADSLQVPVQNSNTSDETVTYVVKDGDTFWILLLSLPEILSNGLLSGKIILI